jgi:transcriptional regulator with XRE-family HTH domain
MENNQNNKLGKKIRSLSTKLKFSQDEFTRKVDIAYLILTKIKREVIKKPSVFTMAKIAKALNIGLDDLLE